MVMAGLMCDKTGKQPHRNLGKCYRQMLKEHKFYWEYKVGVKEAAVQIFPAWWAIPSATMLNSSLITSKKP